MSELTSRLQRSLEHVYRVEGPVAVSGFTIGAEYVEAFVGPGASANRREALVVTHDGEYVDVGLYISEEIVSRAERFVEDTDAAHIDAFCVAVEGVSHFLYFTFCGAALERPVSQIELELQAEVDKFILLRTLVGGEDLVERLFRHIRFAEGLSHDEHERYRVANAHAQRYARWLDRKFARGEGVTAIQDARALYRKPLASKLEHIARAA